MAVQHKTSVGFICLLIYGHVVSGLSEVEFAAFKSKSHVEKYSGKQGYVTITDTRELSFTLKSNGIPDHQTDGVPNNVKEEFYSVAIPNLANRRVDSSVSNCLPEGLIGFAINGVPLFNAFTENCCDSGNARASSFGTCWGNVDALGRYHYTVPPLCLTELQCNNASSILGVALDGYPIYGPYDEFGNLLTSADLDLCHGRTDRHQNYQYHMTFDFPYMIGCFRGTPPPGFLPTQCGCTTLVNPCQQVSSPPPFTPGRVKRSSTLSGISMNTFLKTSVASTCCVSGHNCTLVTNSNAQSGVATQFRVGLFAHILMCVQFMVALVW